MSRIKSGVVNDIYWANAQLELRKEIKNWITGAINRQKATPWRGGHDEGSYTCSWCNFYRLTGEDRIIQFLYWLRDTFRKWSMENQYHGFQAEPREHSNHSFENAEEFLVSLCEMDPENEFNNMLIEDIAHHVGNWVEGIPEWYDWKRHRFVSHWVGTKGVRNEPPYDFELAGHARIGTIVIQAYKATKNERYIEWCKDYAGKWVDIIMNSEDKIPMVTYGTEFDDPEKRKEVYNFGRERVGDPYVGDVWKNITRHAVNFLMKVYELAPDPKYIEAVRKAIDIYEKANMEERYLIELYMNYYACTGENYYKEKLDKWYKENVEPALKVKQMLPNTMILTKKRSSEFDIGEDTANVCKGPARNFGTNDVYGNVSFYRGPTPANYTKGYKISGNLECIERAMALAACELFLTAYSTRDGREHGCESQRYIHGVGEEAVEALNEATRIDVFDYFDAEGRLGLYEKVAVLADYEDGEESAALYFYNYNNENKVVKIGMRDKEAQIKQATSDGTSCKMDGLLAQVELPPKKVIKVEIKL